MWCEKRFRANTIMIIAISRLNIYARRTFCRCEPISQSLADAEIVEKLPENLPDSLKTL